MDTPEELYFRMVTGSKDWRHYWIRRWKSFSTSCFTRNRNFHLVTGLRTSKLINTFIFYLFVLVQEFLSDRLWIFITFFVFRGGSFCKLYFTKHDAGTCFCYSQFALKWIWCRGRPSEEMRSDRIFSNYSDFSRLGNKSRESRKIISQFSSWTKNPFR